LFNKYYGSRFAIGTPTKRYMRVPIITVGTVKFIIKPPEVHYYLYFTVSQ